MLVKKDYYLPKEIADHFRYSASFVYWLARKNKLKAARIRRQLRIPRAEVCRVFCQGTGECEDCQKRKENAKVKF
jgi:excisionase family DNA binding protein